MAANFGITYAVDIVFCIDSTASMRPVIDMVKDQAIHLYDDLMRVMESKNKKIDRMRIKVISFRDYLADGEYAMLESRFFELPRDNEDLARTIRGIEVFGGGDEPEDGLEALAYAMESEWNTDGVRNGGMKNRQIIVMWTDASAHELGFGAKSPYYPKNMPKNFMDLTDMWYNEQMGCMSFQSKRLLLYAPEHTSGWDEIAREWDNVIYYPSNAGEGLQETSYDLIIAQIANSVG